MAFRNVIGTTALVNVKAFLDKFKDAERVEAYVRAGLIYHGEIPFLYRVFEPSDVPSPREKGGYKVVSKFSSLSAERLRVHFALDSQRGFPKSADPRNHAGLLWQTRHQRIPAGGKLHRDEPHWGSRAYLHRGKSKTLSGNFHF